MAYAHLNTTTNFTFLTGASHPHEFIQRAQQLGYEALAITDECSLAGIVKAFAAAQALNYKLIVGSRFTLSNGLSVIAIAPNRAAYAELSGFITLARRRAQKGSYEAHFEDLRFRLQHCLIIFLADPSQSNKNGIIKQLYKAFKQRLWMGINHQFFGGEQNNFIHWQAVAAQYRVPLVACGEALMHTQSRKPLQDILTAIRHNKTLSELGTTLTANAEGYLKPYSQLTEMYPPSLLEQTLILAQQCTFSMTELHYQYPQELVPKSTTPIKHLRHLVAHGKLLRWPKGVPSDVDTLLEKELCLIQELHYEYYFLTVHDLVRYARKNHILCQGRGSAANSVVCYCLFVTEIAPGQINVLFERFISKERDEPPDIDIDFEHQRREEVIQYIYKKYGRERAAIAATVITYRARSAVRDVGKALGMDNSLVDYLAKNIARWDKKESLQAKAVAAGLQVHQQMLQQFFKLVHSILGFPRHLSQHVGGFIIAQDKISNLVPIENASMPERTLIQWDKDDLETMRLLKVDVLALGMLTALRKMLTSISSYNPAIKTLADIPREDPATYNMLCQGDSLGVFQIESRAQMAMLPRLQPRCFYDLVIEIAIVRPGPIQGDMVHPFLRRRSGEEAISYPSQAIQDVLEPTLGVPIFQEQVMRISMVAAGFSGGEADQLRRAITNWGKNSQLLLFEQRFIQGLLKNGYSMDFAQRLFEQVKGFGGYGFPESHSASFALLCYASSWLKCHHPAAFYCALLNSQPMGFYSPSQLIQDAKRHGLCILPVDINHSVYDNTLAHVTIEGSPKNTWGIRLGFMNVKGIKERIGKNIALWRDKILFTSLEDLAQRTPLSSHDMQCLASADVLKSLVGDRHQARWFAAAIEPYSALLDANPHRGSGSLDSLLTQPPTPQKNVLEDYASLGLSLRKHPLFLLREQAPFNRCTPQAKLARLRHKSFVQVAGLVTCMQRPSTANGTLFLTLEDDTGNMNIVVWRGTQETYRQTLLTAKLLLVKGTVEIATEHVASPVVHIIAGQLHDYTHCISGLRVKSRDFR